MLINLIIKYTPPSFNRFTLFRKHIYESINSGADGVAIASMLHYAALKRNGRIVGNYDNEGNIEFLKKKGSFKLFKEGNIPDIKTKLNNVGIPIRIMN